MNAEPTQGNDAGFEFPRRLIVAISSSAIDPPREPTPAAFKAQAEATARAMLPLLLLDNQLVITHGNGPRVGKLLLASAVARERVTPQSLDILVAQTQGGSPTRWRRRSRMRCARPAARATSWAWSRRSRSIRTTRRSRAPQAGRTVLPKPRRRRSRSSSASR